MGEIEGEGMLWGRMEEAVYVQFPHIRFFFSSLCLTSFILFSAFFKSLFLFSDFFYTIFSDLFLNPSIESFLLIFVLFGLNISI